MPVVEATVVVPVPPELAFAVSQTTAPVRYRWDRFIRRQYFLDAATTPARGVRTFTRSRLGASMVSEYVSYHPPSHVGMKMVRGPWFFEVFAGGWRFAPAELPGHTVATWRYNFRCRPGWLRPVAERIGVWLLGREIRRRIAGYARGCADPVVLAAASRTLPGPQG
ncbi:SRPBCC family protein [Longispora sp. K20-0274]|uniref:SRPBCC family protein n=1 Tax=Longispora sp. K20-0274 TaxID=3088255 RepID=UPI003999CA42